MLTFSSSCERCKRHKIRCDRAAPCTNCARMKRKVACEYKPSTRLYRSGDVTPQSPRPEEETTQLTLTAQPELLQAIPQASLLHPENMLSLSRDLFMNRSPDLPSPWPHWTAYASEQVPQPSIMRTAFNDFHTLAVSVTKRLMQAAIAQATSRLRSQRRRTKKGVMPFVKTRDVLSAIDILGMKRDGRSRWTGVARRCNVRVFDEQRTTRFKVKQREMSWDQAEQILGLYDAVSGPPVADPIPDEYTADSDPHSEAAFKRRAARAGTPLPMENLSLTMSGSASDSVFVVFDDEEVEDSSRDEEGSERPTSAEPGDIFPESLREKQNLEQFDQEASRQEEQVLCSRLELTIETKIRSPSIDGSGTDDQQRLVNNVDDWRSWTEYRAEWEEHETPVPASSFLDDKIPPATLAAYRRDVDSDASSNISGSPQPSRRTQHAAVELRAQNPRSYAAMRSDAYGLRDDASTFDEYEVDATDANAPTQSIEDDDSMQSTNSRDAMEWER